MTTPMQAPSFNKRAAQGFSLVELMVALAIGLVVIGAVLVSYLGSSTNSRQSTSLAQMTEDATVALNLLRTHIATAGYSRSVGVIDSTDSNGNPIKVMQRAYTGFGPGGDRNDFIVGCDGGIGGFNDNRAKELDISALTCQADSATNELAKNPPDSIAVAYEADTTNTMDAGGNVPTDCLGRALLQRADAATPTRTYFVASNRFYIGKSATTGELELYCQGNGGMDELPVDDTIDGTKASQQPLVENIVDLQITYGIANTAGTGANVRVEKEARQYLSATQIRALPVSTDLWNRVVSVRLCVEVRSASPAAAGEAGLGGYVNCQGTAVKLPADGRLHRSFWTTVVLHNRI